MDHLIHISIATDNDAFGISYADQAVEVARILRDLADRVEDRPDYLDPMAGITPCLNDSNGNRVGHLSFEVA